MKESKSVKKRRISERERRRISTNKERHGADWFHRNAKKAGKLTPTKFNSETASAAAKKRWSAHREKGVQHGSTNSQSGTDA